MNNSNDNFELVLTDEIAEPTESKIELISSQSENKFWQIIKEFESEIDFDSFIQNEPYKLMHMVNKSQNIFSKIILKHICNYIRILKSHRPNVLKVLTIFVLFNTELLRAQKLKNCSNTFSIIVLNKRF